MLTRLTDLTLSENHGVGDAGVRAIVGSPSAANLVELILVSTNITADGFRALANSPWLGRLRELQLGGNPIPPAEALSLVESPHLKSLTDVWVDASLLGPEEKSAIRQRFGPHSFY